MKELHTLNALTKHTCTWIFLAKIAPDVNKWSEGAEISLNKKGNTRSFMLDSQIPACFTALNWQIRRWILCPAFYPFNITPNILQTVLRYICLAKNPQVSNDWEMKWYFLFATVQAWAGINTATKDVLILEILQASLSMISLLRHKV